MIPWYQNLPLWVTFFPLIGALLLLLVPKGQRRTFELGALAITMIDFLMSVPLWLQYRPELGGGAVGDLHGLDPEPRGQVQHRHGRHQPGHGAADHPSGVHRGVVLVHLHQRTPQGVRHLDPGHAVQHDGRVHHPGHVPVLPVLGSDAGADVLPHRHLGRPPAALRGDQAVPLHPVRFGADAGGHPGHLLPAVQDHRPLRHVHRLVPGHGRHHRPAEPQLPAADRPGVLRRVRHQGADVPLPHLAA